MAQDQVAKSNYDKTQKSFFTHIFILFMYPYRACFIFIHSPYLISIYDNKAPILSVQIVQAYFTCHGLNKDQRNDKTPQLWALKCYDMLYPNTLKLLGLRRHFQLLAFTLLLLRNDHPNGYRRNKLFQNCNYHWKWHN